MPFNLFSRRKISNETFRLMVEAAPNAMITVNQEGKINFANLQAETLFGYSRAQLIGQPLEILIPKRFRETHPGYRKKFFAEPKTRAMGAGRDLFGLRKDGHEIPIEIGLNPIETAEGPIVLASIIDITERKRAEERFRLAVEAAPNAMIMVNQEGKITLANTQAENLFGYPREELFGNTIEMLVPERFRGNHPGYRDQFFTAPKTRSMGAGRDLFGLRKDGNEIPIEIGLNPITTSEGTFVLASIIDITERKRMAAELQTIEKLTALGVMAAGVAHELNNPMMGILNFIQYAIKHEDPGHKIFPVLQDAEREILRCNRIIENLLTFAHAEKRKEAFYQNKEIGELLEVVLKRLSDRIKAENIVVKKEITPGKSEVKMNLEGLDRVFTNLVTNAIDSMQKSSKKELSILVGQEKNFLSVEIKDTGSGISPEILSKIFDPFFTTKQPGKGTGLGLSICRSIIREHQGEILCESRVGNGTTFKILIPHR
jgi:PAS domain S-box-containing protein